MLVSVVLGPVTRRSISANQGLDFNLGVFFFLVNTFSCIIFSILFRVSVVVNFLSQLIFIFPLFLGMVM